MSEYYVEDRTHGNFYLMDNEIHDNYLATGIIDTYCFTVYGSLKRFANNGKCFPSMKTLATKSGCSERKVRDVIKTLEDAGLIRVTERYNKDGSQTSYLYTILPIEKESTPRHHVPTPLHSVQDPPAQRADEQDSVNKIDDQGASPDAEPEPQTIEEADVLYGKCARLYEATTRDVITPMIADEIYEAALIYGMEKIRRALMVAVEAGAKKPWPYALKVLENDYRKAVGFTPEELAERKAAAIAIQEENLRASEDKEQMSPEKIAEIKEQFAKLNLRGRKE